MVLVYQDHPVVHLGPWRETICVIKIVGEYVNLLCLLGHLYLQNHLGHLEVPGNTHTYHNTLCSCSIDLLPVCRLLLYYPSLLVDPVVQVGLLPQVGLEYQFDPSLPGCVNTADLNSYL